MTSSESRIRRRLSDDLLSAQKSRDVVGIRLIRTLLAALDNAGAVRAPEPPSDSPPSPFAGSGAFGSTEAERRTLAKEDVVRVLRDELGEIEDAIASMGGADVPDEIAVQRDLAKAYVAFAEEE